MRVSAIIVAAGKGKRLGGIDKAFVEIKGKPVILYSVETFLSFEEISEIIIVLNTENIEKAKKLISGKRARFVLGGKMRAESVMNGVKIAKEDFVMVHDAARPFVTKKLVKALMEQAKTADSVIPAIPVKPTIKEVENGYVKRTIPRETLVSVQTPQIFKKDKLFEAYKTLPFENATDEASLVEQIGGTVKVIHGIEENIKITTPFDLMLLESIIKKWNASG